MCKALHWTLAVHISLPDQNGWALVSTYAPGDPWYNSLSRKEESSPKLGYSGATWTTDLNVGHSGGKARWSDNDLARATYIFYGTQLRWIAYKDSSSGIADITVDGQTASVDLYSLEPVAQSEVYRGENLSPGFHSVAIDVTANKNELSSGYKVWIDAVDDDPPWTAYLMNTNFASGRRVAMAKSNKAEALFIADTLAARRRDRPFIYEYLYGSER